MRGSLGLVLVLCPSPSFVCRNFEDEDEHKSRAEFSGTLLARIFHPCLRSADFPVCRIAGFPARWPVRPSNTLPTGKSAIQQARMPALQAEEPFAQFECEISGLDASIIGPLAQFPCVSRARAAIHCSQWN